jgi:hypothetical protein
LAKGEIASPAGAVDQVLQPARWLAKFPRNLAIHGEKSRLTFGKLAGNRTGRPVEEMDLLFPPAKL